MAHNAVRQTITREIALLAGLLFAGLVLMPIAIYWIGQSVFGAYGGQGFGDFFGTLSAKVRAGEPVTWFFILAPYLGYQVLRLTAYGWHRASNPNL